MMVTSMADFDEHISIYIYIPHINLDLIVIHVLIIYLISR